MDDAWLVDAAAWAAVRPYGAVAGAVVVDSGAVRWFRTEIQYEGFNGVLSARLSERGLDGAIQQALAPFQEPGCQCSGTWGRPARHGPCRGRWRPPAWPPTRTSPGMVADLGALGPPPAVPRGLEIRRVRDQVSRYRYPPAG